MFSYVKKILKRQKQKIISSDEMVERIKEVEIHIADKISTLLLVKLSNEATFNSMLTFEEMNKSLKNDPKAYGLGFTKEEVKMVNKKKNPHLRTCHMREYLKKYGYDIYSMETNYDREYIIFHLGTIDKEKPPSYFDIKLNLN